MCCQSRFPYEVHVPLSSSQLESANSSAVELDLTTMKEECLPVARPVASDNHQILTMASLPLAQPVGCTKENEFTDVNPSTQSSHSLTSSPAPSLPALLSPGSPPSGSTQTSSNSTSCLFLFFYLFASFEIISILIFSLRLLSIESGWNRSVFYFVLLFCCFVFYSLSCSQFLFFIIFDYFSRDLNQLQNTACHSSELKLCFSRGRCSH